MLVQEEDVAVTFSYCCDTKETQYQAPASSALNLTTSVKSKLYLEAHFPFTSCPEQSPLYKVSYQYMSIQYSKIAVL